MHEFRYSLPQRYLIQKFQGYWPESLLTPPDATAMEKDIRAIKAVGFNTVRVHAVVMGAAFYALCDRLGLFVARNLQPAKYRKIYQHITKYHKIYTKYILKYIQI